MEVEGSLSTGGRKVPNVEKHAYIAKISKY
jgi:hypothetical protein